MNEILGNITGKIFAFIWFVFVALLVREIREKHKVRIIVLAILVALPFVMFGILFVLLARTSV